MDVIMYHPFWFTEGIYRPESLDHRQVRFNVEMGMGWTQSLTTGSGIVANGLLLVYVVSHGPTVIAFAVAGPSVSFRPTALDIPLIPPLKSFTRPRQFIHRYLTATIMDTVIIPILKS